MTPDAETVRVIVAWLRREADDDAGVLRFMSWPGWRRLLWALFNPRRFGSLYGAYMRSIQIADAIESGSPFKETSDAE